MKLKNKNIILVLLLFISIGFAVLTSNLSIIGTASFTDASFDVHFENAKVEDKNIDDGTITIGNDTISITSTGTFEKPGDYINTSFYVMNSGTMDAQLNTLTIAGLTNELKNYFSYTLTYDIGGSNVARGDVLRAGQGRKINLHIEYKYDVDQLSTANNLNITTTMNYINPKKAITSTVWDYEYTGREQYFIANKSGNYKLEAWGAQGGNINLESGVARGGYGGYSTGKIKLYKNSILYVIVGGHGEFDAITDALYIGVSSCNKFNLGGYNGGGRGTKGCNGANIAGGGGGGGATHIATINGTLESIGVNNLDNIYIVAAGGGGGIYNSFNEYGNASGGNGGGYIGKIEYDQSPANQSTGYMFGKGADSVTDQTNGGGGGGLYGGYADLVNDGHGWMAGCGGSGYIGNTNLTDKIMYCYNCPSSENEEDETNIKTRSTTNFSETPTSNYAKIGNGFARITYLGN